MIDKLYPLRYIGVFVLLTAVLSLIDQQWVKDSLYFSRPDIDGGQWWQLWTGNLCHATPLHWLMNIAAVVVLSVFFSQYIDRWHGLATVLVMMPAVGLGLYFLNPELHFYTGFSGVVQGWLSCLLVRSFAETPKFNILLLALQWGRIIYEQMPGYDVNYMQHLINASVAVDAHLYGAAAGVVCGLLCLLIDRSKNINSFVQS